MPLQRFSSSSRASSFGPGLSPHCSRELAQLLAARMNGVRWWTLVAFARSILEVGSPPLTLTTMSIIWPRLSGEFISSEPATSLLLVSDRRRPAGWRSGGTGPTAVQRSKKKCPRDPQPFRQLVLRVGACSSFQRSFLLRNELIARLSSTSRVPVDQDARGVGRGGAQACEAASCSASAAAAASAC